MPPIARKNSTAPLGDWGLLRLCRSRDAGWRHVARRGRDYEHGCAIVRVDHFEDADPETENAVTVTKVVASSEEAEEEVVRLQELAAASGRACHYFWQTTRVYGTAKRES